MTRPLIGVSTYAVPASWSSWQSVTAALLPYAYVRAVTAAGGRPVLLPPVADEDDPVEAAAQLVTVLDGLIIAGGSDVSPQRYGEATHERTQPADERRDASELALVEAAIACDLPLLGICRGMQVMAVAAGGALHQHLPDVVGSTTHSPEPGQYGEHPVDIEDGSLLCALIGDRADVHSYHHQAVSSAPGYRISAHAPDGTVEAFEDPTGRFRVGVQWHPEVRADAGLFAGLVRAAAGQA